MIPPNSDKMTKLPYHTPPELVKMWTKFIGDRKEHEINVLENILRKYDCQTVFETCLGTGDDAITLIKKGFEVRSNEVDQGFIDEAVKNAEKENVVLDITNYDWLDLVELPREENDAAINLGNSFAYLLEREKRIRTLQGFKNFLGPNGILIIDVRNYDYILNQRRKILKDPIKNFRYSGKVRYDGKLVKGYPVKIGESQVIFEYLDVANGNKEHLVLYPIRRQEMENILRNSGFRILESMSDFEPRIHENADFFQYVAIKD